MPRRAREYTRIRKRIFVVAGITLLVVSIVAGLLSWLLSSLVGPANLYRLRIADAASRPSVLGSGVNLNQVEPASFLHDRSFEPFVFRHALNLVGGSGTRLYASSEDASAGIYGDGFFDGASARILAMTRDGLTLRKTASVVRFGINRVGIFQPLILPADVPAGASVLAFARNDSHSLAVGGNGLVLRNVASQTIVSGNSGISADLTGVTPLGAGFLCVSAAGDAAFSADGTAWQPWTVGAPCSLTSVAAADPGLAVAVGLDGVILVGSNGYLNPVGSGTTRHLRSIAYGNGRFIAAGDGVLLQSGNGLVWEPLADSRPSALQSETRWQSVTFQDDRFILTGSHGQVAVSEGSNLTGQTVDASQTYVDAVMLPGQQMILLDQDGHFSISNDQGQTWQKSGIETGMTSRSIDLAGKDKILSAGADGRLGQASIVAEIELDSPVSGQSVQPGDLLLLETFSDEVPASHLGKGAGLARSGMPWSVQGGTAERVAGEAAPSGGRNALRLSAGTSPAGQGETLISQVIDSSLLRSQPKNQVYRLEFYMRQEQIASRTVLAWMSGPFSTVGTRFENVGSTYKKYSFTFVLPVESIRENSEIRLNIGFRGSGTLFVDRVSLGPANELDHGLDRRFAESVSASAPGFIRLAYAGLGSSWTSAEAFAQPADHANPSIDSEGYRDGGVQSIDSGLRLCLDAGAAPYLAIGSQMSQASLQNLLEYLCGPISEPYGQLRLANGRVAPYGDTFDRIIVEFNDDDGLFDSDQQRASFVNAMIRTVEQSSYYRDLKSRLVFVDGMAYQDGVLLSRADYHASDYRLDWTGSADAVAGTAVTQSFLDYFDRIPRTPERTEERYPEFMRRAEVRPDGEGNENQPLLTDLCEILLQDLGRYTSLSCLDYPSSGNPDQRQLYMAAAGIAARAASGVPLSAGAETAGPEAGSNTGTPVRIYAFRNGENLSAVLLNTGDDPVIVELSTDLALVPATIEKFDAAGQLLSTQTLRRMSNRINLLPGSVALIRTSRPGSSPP